MNKLIGELAPRRILLDPTVTGDESRCGSPTCETNALHFVCPDGPVVKSVSDSGIVLPLVTVATLCAGGASFALARSSAAVVYGIAGVIVMALTTALLWRVEAARRTATVQAASVFALIGVASFADIQERETGAVAAASLLVVAGLTAGAIADNRDGWKGLFRLATAAALSSLVLLTVASAFVAPNRIEIFLVSDIGLSLAFIASFLAESISAAFDRPVKVRPAFSFKSRIPEGAPLPTGRRWGRGLFGLLDDIASLLARSVNAVVKALVFASNKALHAAEQAIQKIEVMVRRFIVRTLQVIREIYRALRAWSGRIWRTIDDRLLPNLLAVAAFSCAALLVSVGSRGEVDYIGSGDGFQAEGWRELLVILSVGLSAAGFLVVAWSSYGDAYWTALLTIGVVAVYVAAVGSLIVSMTVLTAVVGIPVVELVPGVGELVSGGPYAFGPASLVVLVGLASLVAYLMFRGRREAADSASEGMGLAEWLRRLPDLIRSLRLETLGPVLMVVPPLAALAVVIPGVLE